MRRAKLFSGLERFWHWTQMALIFGLLLTGFEIHGAYRVLGFEQAYGTHRILAWTLIWSRATRIWRKRSGRPESSQSFR